MSHLEEALRLLPTSVRSARAALRAYDDDPRITKAVASLVDAAELLTVIVSRLADKEES